MIAMVINSTGMSFLWPLHTIYIHDQLERTLSEAGFVLMLHAGAEVFGSLIGGYVYDRAGGKKTLLVSVLSSAMCIFILSANLSWPFYIIVMISLGFCIGMIFPAIYAMTGLAWREGGRKSFDLLYLAQNLGVSVGSALGGLVAQFSFTSVFLVNGLTYLLFISVIWKSFEDVQAEPSPEQEQDFQKPIHTRLRDSKGFGALLVMCSGFMFCWISYVQWQTSISTYMQQLGFPLTAYSSMWTINGLLIVAAQPVRHWIAETLVPSMRLQLLIGIVLMTACFAVLSQFQAYSGFLMAMAVMTLGEILIFPAVPSIADQLAPDGRRGIYQGIVNGAANVGRTIGPLIGGLLTDEYGTIVLFYVIILICGFAFLCFGSFQRFGYPKNLQKTSAGKALENNE